MSAPENLTRELERLGARFGRAVVREEAKRLFKGKRGMKLKSDWPHLMAGFEADARDLIEGRDPLKIRPNHFIATRFADKFPDPNVESLSIIKRIEKKLRAERLRAAALGAFWISEKEYPFPIYLKIFDQYGHLNPPLKNHIFFHLNELTRYRKLIGEPPEEMTIGEICARLDRHILTPQVNALQEFCHPTSP